MIFVTVGKGIDPFDRLVKAADGLAAETGEKVFIQYGCSSYKPVHAEGRDFITFPEAEDMMKKSSVIIFLGVNLKTVPFPLAPPALVVP